MKKKPVPTEFVFPENLTAHIASCVTVSAAQAAEIAGVSKRRILYWARKGLLRGAPAGATCAFTLADVEKATLIAYALSQGLTLAEARRAVESRRLRPKEVASVPAGPPPLRIVSANIGSRLASMF